MAEARLPIAIVGAGFSGTMTALHLLATSPERPILLCGRGGSFARGVAYGTGDPLHLLNVRASNMSAFPDRPDHFALWLQEPRNGCAAERHETEAGQFVSRALYGRYLVDLLESSADSAEGARRLGQVPDEVVALRRHPDGGLSMDLASGGQHRVAGAVIAVGNLSAPEASSGSIVRDPWAVPFAEGLTPGKPVVVLGTGLTMVDTVMSLHASGFPGPVIALSRRGLLPRMHAPPAPWALRDFGSAGERRLSHMLRLLRREVDAATAAGRPWQSVMDAVRPLTASLWRNLSEAQQARFVRHLRPWWDVHRHRTAPPVGRQLQALIDAGYLHVAAGRLGAAEERADGVLVRWSPRGGAADETIAAQRLIVATGTPPGSAARDSLLAGLIRSGLARMDRHGLGLDVTEDLNLVDGSGQPVPDLWALGPIVRGTFWECTAVPDIRVDAQRLAGRIGHTCAG